MRLTELAIDGYANFRNLRLGKFSDGLNFIYGENGVGKTALRTFLRNILFGSDSLASTHESIRPSLGHLNIRQGAEEFRVQRDTHVNDNLRIHALSGSMFDQVGSLSQLTGNWNTEIYDSIFSFSFQETRENVRRLSLVLQNQLGVQPGVGAAGDNVAYQNWQRESASRANRLVAIEQQIAALTNDKNNYLQEIENLENTKRIRLAELDREIHSLNERLSQVDLTHRQRELANVEREIAELRNSIERTVETQVTYVPGPPVTEPHALLYQRLDEIDNQIRRWRRVQSDIQSQRVRLKDDMDAWNQMTLDSTEHPYHNAREIVLSMERSVEQAAGVANKWQDSDAHNLDPSTEFASIRALCDQLRSDLHGLCEELGHQYKHIRNKTVAAELKQLRRCYNEMGDNTQRLIQRRNEVILEIRNVDPAGAEAIDRSETDFCHSALHEGYLEARRKHVGPMVTGGISPKIHRVLSPDLTEERRRLQSLDLQRQAILDWLASHEADFGNLKLRHADCVRQRESVLHSTDIQVWKERLANIEQELRSLDDEYQLLIPRVEEDRRYVKPTPNPILERAANLLARITEGELTQVFLGEVFDADLQIRDRFGKILNFSALEKGQQDQAYFCLAIAAKESLAARGVEAPVLIDDAFANLVRDRLTPTLSQMAELCESGHQIIVLTQHRYLADRIPNAAVFELPPSISFPAPFSSPDRSPGLPDGPLPSTNFRPTPFVSNFDNEFVSTSNRLYPLSKYSALEMDSSYQKKQNFIVPHPTVANYRASRSEEILRTGNSGVSTIPVDQVGDPLGYGIAIDDDTMLDRLEVLDVDQLRALATVEIETVGNLLAIDPAEMPLRLREHGISNDQFDRWQAHIWLLSNVPGLRVDDARVLVACGVTEPEHLATSHAQQLYERIQRFRSAPDGHRYTKAIDTISIHRINGWQRSLDSTRASWERVEGNSRWSRRRSYRAKSAESYRIQDNDYARDRSDRGGARRSERGDRAYSVRTPRKSRSSDRESRRAPVVARSPRMKTPDIKRTVPALKPVVTSSKSIDSSKSKKSTAKQLRFFLDLDDHLEAAPSIGPKTAERFEKIDVRTVADFLKQTAESMAAKLNYKRITADVVRQWQQQARLVCRIPNLRGHDAQLLVACGFTEAENVSTIQPKQLLEIIGPFSDTKEGLKIIRNGKKPDLKEITDWITWAGHTRSLQAA